MIFNKISLLNKLETLFSKHNRLSICHHIVESFLVDSNNYIPPGIPQVSKRHRPWIFRLNTIWILSEITPNKLHRNSLGMSLKFVFSNTSWKSTNIFCGESSNFFHHCHRNSSKKYFKKAFRISFNDSYRKQQIIFPEITE